MIKVIFALACILECCLSFGQTKVRQIVPKIQEYRNYTNKAELAIVDENYKDALGYYQKAFLIAAEDGKDLYNAFVCAAELYDTMQAASMIDRLAYSGLKKEFVGSTMDEINRRGLFQYLSKDYEAIKNKRWNANEKGLQDFVASLEALEKSDQDIRQKTTDKDSIRAVDSSNVLKLKKLIDDKGFPDYNSVGYFPKGTSPIKPNAIWYIIWHRRPYATIIDPIVKEQLLEGHYRPDQYATLLMIRDVDEYYMLLNKDMFDKVKQEAMNKKREEIYLENMEDYMKKLKYQLNKFGPFYFYNPFVLTFNKRFLDAQNSPLEHR